MHNASCKVNLSVGALWLASVGLGCASFKSAPIVAAHSAPLAPVVSQTPSLGAWMNEQEIKSWDNMQDNISPESPKAPGEPHPSKGVVVAALSKQNPDYYFHWVRDSSHVMSVVAQAGSLKRPYVDRNKINEQFDDFLKFTRRLQTQPSRWGLGEPRYTVTGKADTIPWSRPQYDGPALRALATLDYLNSLDQSIKPATLKLARLVLKTDLDYITKVFNERGYDVWEEFRGDNYQTRLVQLAALEKGADWLQSHQGAKNEIASLRASAKQLEHVLDDHWDPSRGFLRSQLAVVETDGYTSKQTDLDSAVIISVIDADRDHAANSVLDDRVQATVAVLEKLFRDTYPINAHAGLGLVYGRYKDDGYFGGNPWYLITAYYARFYFELARKVESGQALQLTLRNQEFLKQSLPREVFKQLRVGESVAGGTPLQAMIVEAFRIKGDAILERLRDASPKDGQLYEQFDKKTGEPVSSRGIGWAHAAYLNAFFARERLIEAQTHRTLQSITSPR